MLQSISPYALLCASKPKPPRHVPAQYDTYSLSQTINTPQVPASSRQSDLSSQHIPMQSPPQGKRTHYIADIHARHTSAMRSASQSSSPL